jgi:MoaA/NifB/PqqE/SkfB family radical SAM enzyme
MFVFDVELASPCNAKCEFCPQRAHGVERGRPFMDEAVLDKMTDEMGKLAREEPVHVVLCGMGDNLVRKPLVIRCLDNLERVSHGAITTELVTNGSNLTLELLEHESFRKLKLIQVSFTGHDKETYEDIFRLKYERVLENVLAMNAAMPGRLEIATVDLVRLRGHLTEFERFWSEKGIPVTYSKLHSRGGSIANPEAYPGRFRPFSRCEIFDFVCFISSDGFVLSCCHDVRSEHVVGDLRESTLMEIMERKRAMRREAFEGFRICQRCTDFTLERPIDGATPEAV